MNADQGESSNNQQYQKQFFGFTTPEMITGGKSTRQLLIVALIDLD